MLRNGKERERVSWADKKPDITNLFNVFYSSCVFKFITPVSENCHTRPNCRRCYWWWIFRQEGLALDKALGTFTFLLDVSADDALRRDHNTSSWGTVFCTWSDQLLALWGICTAQFLDQKCLPPPFSHAPSRLLRDLHSPWKMQLHISSPIQNQVLAAAVVLQQRNYHWNGDYPGTI